MGNPSPAGEGPGAWALTGTFRVGAGLKPAPTAGCATYRPKSADQAVTLSRREREKYASRISCELPDRRCASPREEPSVSPHITISHLAP